MEDNNNKRAIQYIKNPLPVPKRHEKRELSYDYEVPNEKMHYDILIHEIDDFDI